MAGAVRVFIGVGSNINPELNIKRALELLGELTALVAVSNFYRTEPLRGPGSPPDGEIDAGGPYYNGVVEIGTPLPPQEIKNALLSGIEDSLLRVRSADSFAPRTIDLDLILYGDIVVDSGGLKLPSPEILERAFVAVPLAELAPELTLPGTPVTLAGAAAVFDPGAMVLLADLTKTLRSLVRPA